MWRMRNIYCAIARTLVHCLHLYISVALMSVLFKFTPMQIHPLPRAMTCRYFRFQRDFLTLPQECGCVYSLLKTTTLNVTSGMQALLNLNNKSSTKINLEFGMMVQFNTPVINVVIKSL